MDDGDLEYMESQSEERITGLSARVQALKNITGKIGDEIRSGNSLLEAMVLENPILTFLTRTRLLERPVLKHRIHLEQNYE
ncbi:hypothetical protein DFQ28_011199 [Apophysomyces sp. BC1034]|nr:hypothetical protein DFQ29_009684 [Apophysomyces sp. BC1021]KAG0184400.1 hypothetical protein DFQ28_011199 [Apophysomyces sp. BC1034]